MKSMRSIAQLLALLIFPVAQAAPVTLQTMGRESPPFYILDNGVLSGACPDLMQAIKSQQPELNFTGEASLMSLSLIEQALRQKKVDIICSMGKTADREQIGDFLIPIWRSKHAVMQRKDDPRPVHSLTELAQFSQEQPIIVRRSSIYADRLRQTGVLIDDSSSDIDIMLRKLLGQRSHFYYADEYQLQYIIRQRQLEDRLHVLPVTLYSETLYLLVSKDMSDATRKSLQSAVESLKTSGELQKIQQKYGLGAP